MHSNKLETEIVNFEAGQESLLCSVGDVIRISDRLKSFELGFSRMISSVEDNLNFKIEKSFD